MTDGRLERVVEDRWPVVRRQLNYPAIDRVRVVGSPDAESRAEPAPAAADAYKWDRNEVVISEPYLRALDDGDDTSLIVDAVLEHEVGHYVFFPRDLSHHLQYLRRATETFGDARGETVYTVYADVCDELRLLASGVGGGELLELHRRSLKAAGDAAGSIDGEVYRRIERLVVALYDSLFESVAASVTLTDSEQAYLDRLREIPYFTDEVPEHERNLVRFGHVLLDAVEGLSGALAGQHPAESDHRIAGSGFPTDPARIPDADLEDTLSSAAARGQWPYERITDLLDATAGFTDRFEEAAGGAGVDRAGLTTHNDLIPFYNRWTESFPVYVAETPIRTDDRTRYRSGRKPYEIGDPIGETAVFSSRGVVGVPGVSQVFQKQTARRVRTERRVPDLLVGLDSSGSMPAPTEESHAVLAAFVLANNYYHNGARVGGYNFSADLAYLPPTRDRQQFFSLACARWGGGTVLNWDALGDLLDDHTGNDHETESVETTDGADYEQLVDDLRTRSERTATERQDVDPATLSIIDVDELPDRLERVDHVLITDGDIVNQREVLEYLARVGEATRSFVFLTEESAYEEWASLDVPNTEVYAATEPADLAGLAVRQSRRRHATID